MLTRATSAPETIAFERAYPGTVDQPRRVRAGLTEVAGGCPVIDELVLHRQLGAREVMAGQCKRLLELADRPQVSVQVVRGASAGLGGMVALAEGPGGTVVLAGSVLEDIVGDDDAQVQAADAILDAVRGVAESTAGSRNIIGEALARWTA